MREINLDVSQTIVFGFKQDSSGKVKVDVDDSGRESASMGSFGSVEQQEINIAKGNGGKILYATTSVEKKLEKIILHYFIGAFDNTDGLSEHNRRRQLFNDEVLQSSSFSFSFKKQLLRVMLDKAEPVILKGEIRSNIQGDLKKIMTWRNAFAHGDLLYDTRKGVVLKYYSNGPQKLTMDDDFWELVEKTFKQLNERLEEVGNKVAS